MRFTHDDVRHTGEAIDLLRRAARILHAVGHPDHVYASDQIEVLLSHDGGQAGLVKLLAIMRHQRKGTDQ